MLEYPRMLYKSAGRVRIVSSDAERDEAIAAGWSLLPVADPPAPPETPAFPHGIRVGGFLLTFVEDRNPVTNRLRLRQVITTPSGQEKTIGFIEEQ